MSLLLSDRRQTLLSVDIEQFQVVRINSLFRAGMLRFHEAVKSYDAPTVCRDLIHHPPAMPPRIGQSPTQSQQIESHT